MTSQKAYREPIFKEKSIEKCFKRGERDKSHNDIEIMIFNNQRQGVVHMTVIYTSKLRKSGNSNVLTIPKELIKKLDISEGQPIAFTVVNGQIVLEAVKLVANESDILSIANQVSKQYDSALNNLVNR